MKFKKLIISDNLSYISNLDSDIILTNINCNQKNIIIYGKYYPSIEDIKYKVNNVYNEINSKIYSKYNSKKLYELLRLQQKFEGESQLTQIQDFFLEKKYLENLLEKFHFNEIYVDNLSIVNLASLKDFSTEKSIKLKIRKTFSYPNLKDNIVVLGFFLLIKSFLLKLLFFKKKIINQSYFFAFCSLSNLNKHWQSFNNIKTFKKKIYLVFDLFSKISFFDKKDTYHLINELSFFSLIKNMIFVFRFTSEINQIIKKCNYNFIDNIFLKKSFIFNFKNIYCNILFANALHTFISRNKIVYIRPWTSSLSDFSFFTLLNKNYIVKFFITHDFNAYYHLPYGQIHHKNHNNLHNVTHLAINNKHQTLLRKIGFKSVYIIGSSIKNEVNNFRKNNSIKTSSKKLSINMKFKYIFFIPNSNLKGFYSEYELYLTLSILKKFIYLNSDYKIIYKKRPGRVDTIYTKIINVLQNDVIILESYINPLDIINLSSFIVCKFSTIIEQSILMKKRILRPIFNKKNSFNFYDNFTFSFSNINEFIHILKLKTTIKDSEINTRFPELKLLERVIK